MLKGAGGRSCSGVGSELDRLIKHDRLGMGNDGNARPTKDIEHTEKRNNEDANAGHNPQPGTRRAALRRHSPLLCRCRATRNIDIAYALVRAHAHRGVLFIVTQRSRVLRDLRQSPLRLPGWNNVLEMISWHHMLSITRSRAGATEHCVKIIPIARFSREAPQE